MSQLICDNFIRNSSGDIVFIITDKVSPFTEQINEILSNHQGAQILTICDTGFIWAERTSGEPVVRVVGKVGYINSRFFGEYSCRYIEPEIIVTKNPRGCNDLELVLCDNEYPQYRVSYDGYGLIRVTVDDVIIGEIQKSIIHSWCNGWYIVLVCRDEIATYTVINGVLSPLVDNFVVVPPIKAGFVSAFGRCALDADGNLWWLRPGDSQIAD